MIAHHHIQQARQALDTLDAQAGRLQRWGERLARLLSSGHRLLVAADGGSAAQAQHWVTQLVGCYQGDRPPFSAIALHSDGCTSSAILDGYGPAEVVARQVRAHGRPRDVLVLLSATASTQVAPEAPHLPVGEPAGTPANGPLLTAARTGRDKGLTVWAITGMPAGPLGTVADEVVVIDAVTTAAAREAQLVALHLVCEVVDASLALDGRWSA